MTIEQQINTLRKELREHNYNYYVLDNPIVSDYDFDVKLKELQVLEEENPEFYDANSPTLRVGGEITKNFKTVVHDNRMYSLDNSYSKDDLLDWETRIKKLVDGDIQYTCELKYDGASISLTYENGNLLRAVTRGDGVQGDDVTTNIKTIFGTKYKNTPKLVATPFPPLNFKNGESVCPKIVNTPTKIICQPVKLNVAAKNTGSHPLKASAKRTAIPYCFPNTLYALVAPVFLLPCSLISIPLNFFPIITPVGIDPIK